LNDDAKHKSKDKRRKSKKKDHGHGRRTWYREKFKKSSDVEPDSEDTSSSSSDEEEEGDKKKKNLSKYLNGLCVMGLSSKDDFCGMAHSSSSKRSQKDASDSYFEDEQCDELSSLRKENEGLVDCLTTTTTCLERPISLGKSLCLCL
jgi:hypothetical protein